MENVANTQIARDSYCNKISVQAVHNKVKPKKRLKRSTYYKKRRSKEHHVKKFPVHKQPLKCKNYRENKERLNMYQHLELPNEVDIITVVSNGTARDSDICSVFWRKR